MTSERSYRSALPEEIAIQELQKNSGSQFDPKIVSSFIEMLINSEGRVDIVICGREILNL
ncbi:hypothetical protein JCM17380_27130 [Desulfosporosinus burensis]